MNQFFFKFLIINKTDIKHTINVAIDTNLDFDMSPFGMLAVPLSNSKSYYKLYTIYSDCEFYYLLF